MLVGAGIAGDCFLGSCHPPAQTKQPVTTAAHGSAVPARLPSVGGGRTVRRGILFAPLDAEGRVPPGAIFRDRKSRTRRDRMSLRASPDQAGS